MSHQLLWLVLSFVLAFIIVVQDFKERLISLWLIIIYFLSCCVYVWYFQGIASLLSNALSVSLYMAFSYLVLKLYYFFKEGRFNRVMDKKIGWADALLFFSVGLTFDVVTLIVFSAALFVLSALLSLLLKSFRYYMPFGGVLVLFHNLLIAGFLVVK